MKEQKSKLSSWLQTIGVLLFIGGVLSLIGAILSMFGMIWIDGLIPIKVFFTCILVFLILLTTDKILMSEDK